MQTLQCFILQPCNWTAGTSKRRQTTRFKNQYEKEHGKAENNRTDTFVYIKRLTLIICSGHFLSQWQWSPGQMKKIIFPSPQWTNKQKLISDWVFNLSLFYLKQKKRFEHRYTDFAFFFSASRWSVAIFHFFDFPSSQAASLMKSLLLTVLYTQNNDEW